MDDDVFIGHHAGVLCVFDIRFDGRGAEGREPGLGQQVEAGGAAVGRGVRRGLQEQTELAEVARPGDVHRSELEGAVDEAVRRGKVAVGNGVLKVSEGKVHGAGGLRLLLDVELHEGVAAHPQVEGGAAVVVIVEHGVDDDVPVRSLHQGVERVDDVLLVDEHIEGHAGDARVSECVFILVLHRRKECREGLLRPELVLGVELAVDRVHEALRLLEFVEEHLKERLRVLPVHKDVHPFAGRVFVLEVQLLVLVDGDVDILLHRFIRSFSGFGQRFLDGLVPGRQRRLQHALAVELFVGLLRCIAKKAGPAVAVLRHRRVDAAREVRKVVGEDGLPVVIQFEFVGELEPPGLRVAGEAQLLDVPLRRLEHLFRVHEVLHVLRQFDRPRADAVIRVVFRQPREVGAIHLPFFLNILQKDIARVVLIGHDEPRGRPRVLHREDDARQHEQQHRQHDGDRHLRAGPHLAHRSGFHICHGFHSSSAPQAGLANSHFF